MSYTNRCWAISVAVSAWMLTRSSQAAPDHQQPVERVELTLVGRAGRDLTLDQRVRSLFDPKTRVITHRASELAPASVLEPESPNTLYLWITVGPDGARVYVATREARGLGPRYLFRDLELETGLDEVGSESLAQVAHSSASALWAGGLETSKQAILGELARETKPASPAASTPAAPAAAPVVSVRVTTPPPAKSTHPGGSAADPGARWGLALGAQHAEHFAGDEGWLHEPGVFAALDWRHRVGLRALATYLVPSRFTADATEIRLSGASSDLRMAWLLGGPPGPSARLEAGAGALWIGWSATVPPAATVAPPGRDRRDYLVGALAGELRVGPLRAGARVELRVPLRETVYDWKLPEQTLPIARSFLSPGAAVELGVPLTRF